MKAPFDTWKAKDVGAFVNALPLDPRCPPVAAHARAARPAAKARLQAVPEEAPARLCRGAVAAPRSPEAGHASGLSPYLHFGHISIEEVAAAALATTGAWTPDELRIHNRGKREGYFTDDADVNALPRRGPHLARRGLQLALGRGAPTPRAWSGRCRPGRSPRSGLTRATRARYVYSREEWEAGATHDPLWNAAQRELVATGTIHNYLRMLWGKKVLEWSRTPAEAYQTLEHLNNKYALDGRDPNSYTGILWCFGLFDRPWAPERKVLGVLRYMSSENTARKFKLGPYYEYVNGLPTIEEIRRGRGRE